MNFTDELSGLERQQARYAFYYRRRDQAPVLIANAGRFRSASMIKVPILLAWLELERAGLVSGAEDCDLDAEPQVQGAGFSWLMRARRQPYDDLLLMMIALSDNLATNLVIRRAGLERLQETIHAACGLSGVALQRKLMDYEARARGLENSLTVQDAIHMYAALRGLPEADRRRAEAMLEVNQDAALLCRDHPRDTVVFRHKTGSMEGILHDWGYTDEVDLFLFTEGIRDEPAAFEVFGRLGRLLLEPPAPGL